MTKTVNPPKARITNSERVSLVLSAIIALADKNGKVSVEAVQKEIEVAFNISKRIEAKTITVDGVKYYTCTRSGAMFPKSEMIDNGGRLSVSRESNAILANAMAKFKGAETDLKEKLGITKLEEELKSLSATIVSTDASMEELDKAMKRLPVAKKELLALNEKAKNEVAKLEKPTVSSLIEAGAFNDIKSYIKDGKVVRKVATPKA